MNSTLQGGRNSGRFDYQGYVKNILECLKKCCDVKDCDLAYMGMAGVCYSVHCKDKQLCKAVPAIGGESSNVFYVSRVNSKHKGKVDMENDKQIISIIECSEYLFCA